jgi:hypothetical protein
MRSACLASFLCGALAAAVALPVAAQWSTDPSTNLVLADQPGGQVQPKLVPTADGGFYTSWFDAGSGYDVYLQRLSADGTEQWPHGGILVGDRSFSSTQDYGLAIAGDGDALLAYRSGSDVGAQITVSRIGPDGTLRWGPDGVVVSDDAGGANSPRVAATSDGDAVVAWSASDGAIVLQKLDADGNPLWGDGVSVVPPAGFFLLADLRASDDGSVIASWSAQLSFQDRQLWAQKFNGADGAPMWGSEPVAVFDGTGGAMQFGYFPEFIDDGAGGAVFVWYTVSLSGSVRVQHVLADGDMAFVQNGIVLGTDPDLTYTGPAGAYDPASGDIYAIWHFADAATQGQIGVAAQRLDAAGVRQWGDEGVVLEPQTTTEQSELGALALPGGGVLFSWASDSWPSDMPVHVTRLDTAGLPVWSPAVVDIKTGPTDTARLTGALSAYPFAAWVWEDGTNGGGGGSIKAQAIDFDGMLGGAAGNDTIFSDGFDGP